jgi:hypothetical protein
LRKDYFSGITKLVGMVHGLSNFRISRALEGRKPEGVRDVWDLMQSIGFEPYVVLGQDDFDEMLKHGGNPIREGYAQFRPGVLLDSAAVSEHVKSLIRELF